MASTTAANAATVVVPDKWDASQMPSMRNKLAIVTGANSGIGYVTALELARKGADVVLACRNETRGKEAERRLREELGGVAEAGTVEFMQLDVSSLESVRVFSEAFHKTHDRLDLLINNAGIMAVPYAETVDGLESQFATNHLGHFALTARLFDLLQRSQPSRIVNLSSMAHRSASKFDEDAIMTPRDKYSAWSVYSDSKLANLLFTAELTRRFNAEGITGITAIACHPGLTETNLATAPAETHPWYSRWVWKCLQYLPIYQPAVMGALPTLYAATASNLRGGEFIGPNGFNAMRGHPTIEDPSTQSKSATAARKLWELSERLTKTTFKVTDGSG